MRKTVCCSSVSKQRDNENPTAHQERTDCMNVHIMHEITSPVLNTRMSFWPSDKETVREWYLKYVTCSFAYSISIG